MDPFSALPPPSTASRKLTEAPALLVEEHVEEVREEGEEEEKRDEGRAPKRARLQERQTEEDVVGMIRRLRPLIGDVKKFRKAAALAHRLLDEGEITGSASANEFFSLLEVAFENKIAVNVTYNEAFGKDDRVYAELIRAAVRELSELVDEKKRSTLGVWHLAAVDSFEIRTIDDSFQFNKQSNRLKCLLEMNKSSTNGDEEESRRSKDLAILLCVEAAMERYGFAWTCSSSDVLVQAMHSHFILLGEKAAGEVVDRSSSLMSRIKARQIQMETQCAVVKDGGMSSFDRDAANAANLKFSVRKSVGRSGGDRKAEQWLG